MTYFLLISLIKIIVIIIPLLIGIAYLTLNERKIIGAMQKRLGPNVAGLYGLLHPLADGLKLLLKENILPSNANILLFLIAPMITFTLSFIAWAVIPFDKNIVLSDINLGILYLFAISSLAVYGIIMAGWSSNSKYALLGALRSTAQMISYEVSIGLIVINILLCVGSLNLLDIVFFQKHIWFIIPLFPIAIMFFVSILAETNRHPFDLPEAEGELVAGYNVEYSSMGFALFFIGEYGNIILMSSFMVLLFFGGWLPIMNNSLFLWIPNVIWFGIKTSAVTFAFIWVRVALPRYRYDQLMYLGWKVYLPLSLGFLILVSGIIIGFDFIPYNFI